MRLKDLQEKQFVVWGWTRGSYELHIKRPGHKYADDIYRLSPEGKEILVDILLKAGYEDMTDK